VSEAVEADEQVELAVELATNGLELVEHMAELAPPVGRVFPAGVLFVVIAYDPTEGGAAAVASSTVDVEQLRRAVEHAQRAVGVAAKVETAEALVDAAFAKARERER